MAELAAMAEQQMGRYGSAFKPAEGRFIGRMQQMAEPGQESLAAGMAEGAALRGIEPKIAAGKRGLAVAGVGPASGGSVMREASARTAAGGAEAAAGTGARVGQRERFLSGLSASAGLGGSQGVQAQGSMTAAANQSASNARSELESQMQETEAVAGGLGTATGLGLAGAMRKWG